MTMYMKCVETGSWLGCLNATAIPRIGEEIKISGDDRSIRTVKRVVYTYGGESGRDLVDVDVYLDTVSELTQKRGKK